MLFEMALCSSKRKHVLKLIQILLIRQKFVKKFISELMPFVISQKYFLHVSSIASDHGRLDESLNHLAIC